MRARCDVLDLQIPDARFQIRIRNFKIQGAESGQVDRLAIKGEF